MKDSIRAAGLDPDNLPQSDPSAMNRQRPEEGLEIWGCGRGAVKEIVPARVLIARLKRQYEEARQALKLS
jgi:nitronate monooxygenase